MKVLYHHRTLAEDAQGVHIEEIVRALERGGHSVREASLVKRGGESSSDSSSSRGGLWRVVARLAKGPIYELLEYLYNVPAGRMLRREIRDFDPDLIYERYSLSTVAGIRAARKLGVPHVLEVNAPLVDEKLRWGRLWFRGLARRIERWIFRNSDRVIVVSDVLARIIEEHGAIEDRIRVVRNGVNEERYHPDTSGEAVRERHGIGDDVVLGFVGWFRDWHGIESIVEAIASDDLRDRPVRLLLVGDGPARESIEAAASSLGVADRVHVTGPVDRSDVPEHIAAFDVALQPAATAYACPMKIPEYFASGKPVVAPDQENIRELIRDGVEGTLFRPGDRDDLRRAIRELVTDPQRRIAMGRAARRRVLDEGLSWDRNAERIVEMQREIAAEKRGASR